MSAQQQQPFAKKMRGGQQSSSQPRNKKPQTQQFPYTKVVLQKSEVPTRGGRSKQQASSSGLNSKGKSNVQPNNVIFNNALDLVWQGKMTVNAAIEMFNLPETHFKKQLLVNKNRRKSTNRGGRGKGRAGNQYNMAANEEEWSWEEDGHEFDETY